MTSRLKHKLELENINLNSAYLNESFVLIGTPLPALSNHKKDQLEYVPEWQQEARDEQGRRRFHGAWTGGFSAGYFNTAGSKEGWAPSTFKSSRNNRASKVQRAEDFMDEEDLEQMKSDRHLENTDTFKNEAFAGQRAPAAQSLPSALESLIAPTRNSIGETLLQKLGWRPGQGIGPRVTARKLRLQEAKLARGKIQDENDVEDEEIVGKHLFAPRDVKLLVFQPKEDKQGLGFEKGQGMGPLPGKRAILGTRAPDDDEDDPYGEESSTSHRVAYDFGDEEDEVIVMGGPSRPAFKKPAGRSDASQSNQHQWHDGRPVLPGFELDSKGVPPDKWFEMPEIPPDWRPRPARVWGTTRKWDEGPGAKKETKEVIRGQQGRPLTFEQRGAALGEEQRVSQAKSVHDYMSQKDQERMAALAKSSQSQPPPPLSMSEDQGQPQSLPPADEVIIPPLSPRTASAALKGFIPFGDDLPKQERYRSYLTSQTYNTKEPNPQLRSGTFDEINKELDDFAASARIFKPMSFAMSSRFTAGSSALASSDLKQARPGLHMYDAEKAKADMERAKEAKEAEQLHVKKDMTPREEAAHNGMYGKMTRVVTDFYPVKLLCKRFGVADPHPDGPPKTITIDTSNGTRTADGLPLPKNDASWEDKFIYKAPDGTSSTNAPGPSGDGDGQEERRPRNIGEVGMAEDINQGRDTLSYTKPSIDIFKAIFASDDEEDDDEEEEAKGKEVVPPVQTANGQTAHTEIVTVGQDPYPVKEAPVDLATFKPVFKKRDDDDEKSREERKKEKSEKKKRKRQGALSFAVGEDEEEATAVKIDKKKKRPKDVESREQAQEREVVMAGEGEEEWVEKPAIQPKLASRKGAADFM